MTFGMITNTLGNVDDFGVYCEYQLYCRSLNASIQNFTKATKKELKKYSEKEIVDNIISKLSQCSVAKLTNSFSSEAHFCRQGKEAH